MFTSIRTSEKNKQIVTDLTNKFGLGSENVIARLAIGHSLSQENKLYMGDIEDSKGKEYTKKVLMGENEGIYWAMLCVKYELNKNDKTVVKYLKLHLDNGLNLLSTGTLISDDMFMLGLLRK